MSSTSDISVSIVNNAIQITVANVGPQGASGGGGGSVNSVFGRTGSVVATTNDYNFNQIAGTVANSQMATGTNNTLAGYNNSGVFSDVTIGSGLALSGGVLSSTGGGGAVTSVFGRTGAVVATGGDYTTAQVTESGSLYFTNARAIASTLTGYASSAGVVSSADSILSAIQKLNGNTSALVTGVSSVFTRTGAVTAQSGDYTTAQVTESGSLYFTNARAIASTLTAYASGAGTVSSADSILTAIQKLNGNTAALVTGVSSVFGRTGAVVAATNDYSFAQLSGSLAYSQVTHGTNNTLAGFSNTGVFGVVTIGTNLTLSGGTLSASGSGGGSPGGTSGQIQYNNAGAFGGALVSYTTDSASNPEFTSSTGVLNIAASILQNAAGYVTSGDNFAQMTLNFNTFTQLSLQNTNAGASASSDFVLTCDTGSDTTDYADFGINNSAGAVAPFTAAKAAYLYTVTNELDIGALGASGAVKIYTTGGTTPVLVATFNSSQQLILANPLAVAQGGTGDTSLTAFSLLAGGTTSTAAVQSLASVGTSGQILTSNGAGSLPTWQAASGGSGFSAITSGTNTTAAMVVGTGASLAASGTGAITATAMPASGLTGTTLAASVVSSSLTSVGTLTSLATSGAVVISSNSANALSVGPNGTTNPALNVDASTASSATGLNIKSAAVGSGVTLIPTSSNTNENITITSKGTGSFDYGTGGIGTVAMQMSGANRYSVTTAAHSWAVATSTTAATAKFTWATVNDTALTLSVEATAAFFNFSSTRQHATGALALQRDMRVSGTTHSFVAASTLTSLYTFAVDNYGQAGTNATITTASAIGVVANAVAGTVVNAYAANFIAPTGATTINAALLAADASNTVTLCNGTNAITAVGTVSGTSLTITSGTTLITSTAALTSTPGSSAGTLTNAPSIGNPTKWIAINDNGTTRQIPAW